MVISAEPSAEVRRWLSHPRGTRRLIGQLPWATLLVTHGSQLSRPRRDGTASQVEVVTGAVIVAPVAGSTHETDRASGPTVASKPFETASICLVVPSTLSNVTAFTPSGTMPRAQTSVIRRYVRCAGYARVADGLWVPRRKTVPASSRPRRLGPSLAVPALPVLGPGVSGAFSADVAAALFESAPEGVEGGEEAVFGQRLYQGPIGAGTLERAEAGAPCSERLSRG